VVVPNFGSEGASDRLPIVAPIAFAIACFPWETGKYALSAPFVRFVWLAPHIPVSPD
jgi:hypothetical protein